MADIPTLDQIEESGKNMDTITEEVKSSADTLVDQYGDVRTTMTGREKASADAIADFNERGDTALAGLVAGGDTAIADFNERGDTALAGLVAGGDTAIADFNERGDTALDDFSEQADNIIYSVGFNIKGTFQAGITIENYQDALWYDDGDGPELFAIASNVTLPYVTTGATPDLDGADWRNVTLQDLKTVMLSLNKPFNKGVYATDMVTLLDNIEVIYDNSANQRVWLIPSTLPTGDTIVALSAGNQLVTTSGTTYLLDPVYINTDSADIKAAIGVSGLTDEQITFRLESLVNYCGDNGIRDIIVNEDINTTFEIGRRTEVVFVGNGSIGGMYRRDVIPAMAPSFAFFDTLSNGQLKQFRRTDNPVVVAMGDSTWTKDPQTMSHQDTVWQMLTKKISQQYAEKDISYINRAIGSQTWNHADDIPTEFPDWYTDTGAQWLSYVEAENPDVVVLGFGMNDKYQFDQTKMRSVISKINAFAKVPDIIIATNLVPSLGIPSPIYNSQKKQEGRDFVAGFERTFAMSEGYPLLDFNRCLNIVRDGRDVFQSSMVRQQTNSGDNITSGRFIASDECRDYSAVVHVTGTEQEILDMFTSVNGTMSFQLGYKVDDSVFVFESGGFVRLAFYAGSGGGPYHAVTTDIAIPTSDFYMRVEKSGNKFLLSISDDPSDYPGYEYEGLITHGGLFTPVIGYFLGTTGFASTVTYSKGVHKKYLPAARDSEIWGDPIYPPISQFPNGGNGVNHPSSFGCSAVYAPVINSANFARPYYSIDKGIVLSSGIIATYPAMGVITDSVVTLKGSLFTDGNTELCTLPVDMRPQDTALRLLAPSTTSSVWGTTLVEIAVTGIVTIIDTVPNLVQLDGLCYSVHRSS